MSSDFYRQIKVEEERFRSSPEHAPHYLEVVRALESRNGTAASEVRGALRGLDLNVPLNRTKFQASIQALRDNKYDHHL